MLLPPNCSWLMYIRLYKSCSNVVGKVRGQRPPTCHGNELPLLSVWTWGPNGDRTSVTWVCSKLWQRNGGQGFQGAVYSETSSESRGFITPGISGQWSTWMCSENVIRCSEDCILRFYNVLIYVLHAFTMRNVFTSFTFACLQHISSATSTKSISAQQQRNLETSSAPVGTNGQVLKLRAWRAFGVAKQWQGKNRNPSYQTASDCHQTRNVQKAVQKNMVGQCGPRVSQQKLAAGKRAQAAPFHHKKKNDFMQTHVDLLTNLSLLYDLYAVQGCSDIKLQHSGRSQHGGSCLFIVYGGISQVTAMSQAPHWPTGRNSDGVAFPPGKSRGAKLKKANQSKTTALG